MKHILECTNNLISEGLKDNIINYRDKQRKRNNPIVDHYNKVYKEKGLLKGLIDKGPNQITEINKEWVNRNIKQIQNMVVKKLLSTYNRTWRDNDNPKLNKNDFLKKINFKKCSIDSDDGFIYFEDIKDNLFDGHAIIIRVKNGKITDAHL